MRPLAGRRRLFWFMTPTNGFNPDTCFSIDRASFTINNKQGDLSDWLPYDLWRTTLKNGYKMSFTQWRGRGMDNNLNMGTTGGALLLKCGEDIPLPPGLAPGMPRSTSISIELDVTMFDPALNEDDELDDEEESKVVFMTAIKRLVRRWRFCPPPGRSLCRRCLCIT